MSAARYVWHRPALLGGMSMAFLVNLLAFPLMLGLLQPAKGAVLATMWWHGMGGFVKERAALPEPADRT